MDKDFPCKNCKRSNCVEIDYQHCSYCKRIMPQRKKCPIPNSKYILYDCNLCGCVNSILEIGDPEQNHIPQTGDSEQERKSCVSDLESRLEIAERQIEDLQKTAKENTKYNGVVQALLDMHGCTLPEDWEYRKERGI